MSRWRETLCGSKIKPKDNDVTSLPAHHSEVLSCGGKYMPHPVRLTPAQQRMPLLFLPKDSYEVLALEAQGVTMDRYCEHPEDYLDDMEIMEDALGYFEGKLVK